MTRCGSACSGPDFSLPKPRCSPDSLPVPSRQTSSLQSPDSVGERAARERSVVVRRAAAGTGWVRWGNPACPRVAGGRHPCPSGGAAVGGCAVRSAERPERSRDGVVDSRWWVLPVPASIRPPRGGGVGRVQSLRVRPVQGGSIHSPTVTVSSGRGPAIAWGGSSRSERRGERPWGRERFESRELRVGFWFAGVGVAVGLGGLQHPSSSRGRRRAGGEKREPGSAAGLWVLALTRVPYVHTPFHPYEQPIELPQLRQR